MDLIFICLAISSIGNIVVIDGDDGQIFLSYLVLHHHMRYGWKKRISNWTLSRDTLLSLRSQLKRVYSKSNEKWCILSLNLFRMSYCFVFRVTAACFLFVGKCPSCIASVFSCPLYTVEQTDPLSKWVYLSEINHRANTVIWLRVLYE